MGPRIEELPEPGDLMVHTLGPESLLFIRNADGAIRGLFNVCRHRGNRLLLCGDGPGHARELHCAFHGWRYALDGTNTHIPCRERFDRRSVDDPDVTTLESFRVEEFAGWLWYTFDAEAPGLAEYLGPLGPKLARYRMQRAHIVDYKTFEFRCNWKTVLDAFNESYHFQTLHSEILAWGNEDAPITLLNIHSMMINEYGAPSKLYGEQVLLNAALEALLRQNGIDPATFSDGAAGVRKAVQRAKRSQQHSSVFPYADLADGQLSDAYHFLVFPSVHFNLFPEFYVAMRYRPHPSGDPERMYYDFIMCAPLAANEERPDYEHRIVAGGAEPVSEVLDWGIRQHPVVDEVLSQDVGLVEHVQRGQRSRGFAGAVLGTDERRITHFHRNIDELISGCSVRDLMQRCEVEPDAHQEPDG
jgi:phenylpropionate dioxygenase-like ring-hydroxylating dioxygenase large terminal subunit